jgi:methyltransferase (TIGR00027 family)
VSRTAQYVALYRAMENIEPRPRFRDPFASAFLSPDLALVVRLARLLRLRGVLARYADRRAPGARTSAIARTCFVDDVVRRTAVAGVRQVVLLGAGFDCRAHRMPELAGSRVFEVDRSETQASKRAHLAHLSSLRDDVRYVPVDFLRDDVSRRLTDAGWQADRPTLFIWEGVTNYLTEAAVTAILSWIGGCASGTSVVFTYVHAGLLDGSESFEGGDQILRNVRVLGEPWTFGLYPDRVASFLASRGLGLEEDAGADDYRRRYLGDSPQLLRGYAFYRIAVASVQDRG